MANVGFAGRLTSTNTTVTYDRMGNGGRFWWVATGTFASGTVALKMRFKSAETTPADVDVTIKSATAAVSEEVAIPQNVVIFADITGAGGSADVDVLLSPIGRRGEA